MLCNNVDVRRCLYFEPGLPVISLVDWSVWEGGGICYCGLWKWQVHFDGFEKDTKPFFNSNLRREEQTTVGQPLDNPLDAPRTHKEPRKTKDEMEDDL